MRPFFRFFFLAAIVFASSLPFYSRAAAMEAFSETDTASTPDSGMIEGCDPAQPCFRFLWPEEPGSVKMTPLIGEPGESGVEETPLGRAKTAIVSWRSSAGDEVLTSKTYYYPDHGDFRSLVIETEIKKEISVAGGDYFKPHFAAPAIRPPLSHSRTLCYEVNAFSPPSDKPIPTSGPIMTFDDDLNATIFSPLDNFMASMQAPVNGEWRLGFGGSVKNVPAGTVHRVLVVSGRGVNATMAAWGDGLRKWHGRERPARDAEPGLKYLGYYTDNGAYYYYKTAPGKNYHDTLMAVKRDADERGIPYGYFQVDSWWYPKARSNNIMNAFTGGALLWEPMDDMFPAGLAGFSRELGLPLVAHNRWYDRTSPYCDRHECVRGEGHKRAALPIEDEFWDEIMDNAVSYGVSVYEQDWLHTQMNMIPWLRSGLNNAESWFDAMVRAADERGLHVQLCMASPEFFLQQVKHPNVTEVRASGDYIAGVPKTYYWPKFHKTSMFAHAAGLWPFKDNFQSSSGQRTIRNEKWPYEEALISLLSAGPVGPGDKIGAADVELLMKTCRQDGVLLKPDRPATPIDLMFLDSKKPWIVTTESDHEAGRTVYLAAFNLWPARMKDPSIALSDLGIEDERIIYNHKEKDLLLGSDRIDFGKMKRNEANYYVLVPILENGMALLGETDKFACLSGERFPEVKIDGCALKITVMGVPGETVPVSIYSPRPPQKMAGCGMANMPADFKEGVITIKVVIPASGQICVSVE